MSNLAPALLCVLSSLATACAWSDVHPTLVFQLQRVEREKWTLDGAQQARELVLSAAVSVALDPAEAAHPTPSTIDAAQGPAEGKEFDLTAPDPIGPDFDAAFSCNQSPALCAWAYSAEEAAFVAVLESRGVLL